MSNFHKIAHDAAQRSASTGEDSTSLIVNTSARNTKRKEAGYKPIRLPVYDRGGDISTEASERLRLQGDAGLQSFLSESSADVSKNPNSVHSTEAKNAAAAENIGKNVGTITNAAKSEPLIKQPTYMPRTSAQKIAAEPDVEAPLIAIPAPNMKSLPSAIAAPVADSGGDVPIDVNDGQHQVAILQDGEKVLTPEEADSYRAQQSTMKPLGAPQSKPSIGPIEPTTADSTETQVTARGTPEERAAIKTDKQKAMGSGDLVALGKAALAERHLEPSTSDVAGPITERPTAGYPKIALPQEEHQATAGGPLISGAPSAETPSEQRDLRNIERKARVADLERQRQDALKSGDLSTADRLAVAKDELQKTPWSDRSLLGKIGKVASVAGNIAGDIVNPNIMSLIPGTDANRAAKEQSAYGRILPDTEAEEKAAQTAVEKDTPEQKTSRALLEKGYTLGKDVQGNPVLNEIPGFRDSSKDMQGLLASTVQDEVAAGRDPMQSPSVKRIMSVMQGVQKPEKPEHEDDKERYAVQYLKDNNLPDTANNRDKAYKAFATANQAPEHPTLMLVPDGKGGYKAIGVQSGSTVSGEAVKPGEPAQASRKSIVDHDKAYVQPANAVEKSYDMMDHAFQEYEDARAKGKDLPTGAQSMVALSTHLSTTFGNVKGARITKDMIQEHLGARGISDKALVAFQKLTNGDVLSPDQWEAFHNLISESRTLSWQTAVKEAERKRVPMNFLPDDLTAVKVPGHAASTIHTSQLQKFQKDFPNAVVLSEKE